MHLPPDEEARPEGDRAGESFDGTRGDHHSSPVRAALAYAQALGPVFPVHSHRGGVCTCRMGRGCDRTAKHPANRNGKSDATRDPELITRCWGEVVPWANIGVVCTPDSGLVIIDIDGQEELDTFRHLVDDHGGLPATLWQRSGRVEPGWHVLFRRPPHPLQGTLEGLLVRGNGYFIAAPSLHRSGRRYRWLNWGVEPAELPDWLLEELTPRRPSQGPGHVRGRAPITGWTAWGRSVLERELALAREAEEGTHHPTLVRCAVRLAGAVHGGHLDWELVDQGIHAVADEWDKDGPKIDAILGWAFENADPRGPQGAA